MLFEAPNARGLLRVVVMLGLIWWMYGGYAWMTNAVDTNTLARRLVLLAAMGAYFMLALAIPDAFGDTGLAFGLAYLCVVVLHSALFTRASVASAVRAILTLAPYNLVAAFVVIAGGALGGTPQYVLWAAAAVFEWLSPTFQGPGRLPGRSGALRGASRPGGDRRDRRVRRGHRLRSLAAATRRARSSPWPQSASPSAHACGGSTSAATTSARSAR